MTEAQPDQITTPAPDQDKPQLFRFTPANARLMAQRSAEARRKRREQQEAEPSALAASSEGQDVYLTERLARIRQQLTRLDRLALQTTDELKLERLARAQTQLAEQERIATGRPLPGQRRPGPAKAAHSPDVRPL